MLLDTPIQTRDLILSSIDASHAHGAYAIWIRDPEVTRFSRGALHAARRDRARRLYCQNEWQQRQSAARHISARGAAAPHRQHQAWPDRQVPQGGTYRRRHRSQDCWGRDLPLKRWRQCQIMPLLCSVLNALKLVSMPVTILSTCIQSRWICRGRPPPWRKALRRN